MGSLSTEPVNITADNVLQLFPCLFPLDHKFDESKSISTDDSKLSGIADAEQRRLMAEICIVLNNDDVPIALGSKIECE